MLGLPFDVAKSRLQAPGSSQYRGLGDCLLKTVRSEGPLALYKGFVPIVVRKVLWCSAFFLCYERLRVGLRAREKI